MRNRILAITMVVFVAFAFMPMPVASAESAAAGMADKFAVGTVNLLTGWLEVPAQTLKGANRGIEGIENKPTTHSAGTVYGMIRGVSHGAGRTLSGAGDMVGFWAADYSSNDGYGQALDAEYAWDEGTYHSLTKPDLAEGLKPIPMKAMRGIENAVLSPLAIPSHVMIGGKESAGDAGLGLFKGTWHGLSRLYDGAMDIGTFALPNPEGTVGLKFDQDKPLKEFEMAIS